MTRAAASAHLHNHNRCRLVLAVRRQHTVPRDEAEMVAVALEAHQQVAQHAEGRACAAPLLVVLCREWRGVGRGGGLSSGALLPAGAGGWAVQQSVGAGGGAGSPASRLSTSSSSATSSMLRPGQHPQTALHAQGFAPGGCCTRLSVRRPTHLTRSSCMFSRVQGTSEAKSGRPAAAASAAGPPRRGSRRGLGLRDRMRSRGDVPVMIACERCAG